MLSKSLVHPPLKLLKISTKLLSENTQVATGPKMVWLPQAELEQQVLLVPELEELKLALHRTIGLQVLLGAIQEPFCISDVTTKAAGELVLLAMGVLAPSMPAPRAQGTALYLGLTI